MATQIQLRRGTAAEWTAANPILAEGEMGIELDTSKFKIGNGINAWDTLDYGFTSIPAGGTTGQILAKDSSTDYDFAWIDNYTEELGLTVRNTTGATLTKGTVVYINGGNSSRVTVAKAIATSEASSAGTIGMVKNDIANNTNGVIITSGSVTGLNTNGLTGGAPLWLSESTAGTWSATPVAAANHLVLIGYVENVNSSNGSVYIKTATFPEINELTGVEISTLSNGEVLTYETSSGLWKNKPLPSTGATELNDLTDVTITGTPTNGQVLTYDSATSQWKQATPASGGATDLDNLTDVTISGTPTNGQTLIYDTATSQWINGAAPNGATLIDTKTFSGAAPASFTSIPQTYTHLKLILKITSLGTLTSPIIATLNGGTSTAQTFVRPTTATSANTTNAGGMGFSSATAVNAGITEMLLKHYSQSTFVKYAVVEGTEGTGIGRIAGTTAITQIGFSLNVGVWTLATGTVELYGIK